MDRNLFFSQVTSAGDFVSEGAGRRLEEGKSSWGTECTSERLWSAGFSGSCRDSPIAEKGTASCTTDAVGAKSALLSRSMSGLP